MKKSKKISSNKKKSTWPFKKIKVDPLLQRALDSFPKLVKEEERNFKARERDIRRFDDLVKLLVSGKAK